MPSVKQYIFVKDWKGYRDEDVDQSIELVSSSIPNSGHVKSVLYLDIRESDLVINGQRVTSLGLADFIETCARDLSNVTQAIVLRVALDDFPTPPPGNSLCPRDCQHTILHDIRETKPYVARNWAECAKGQMYCKLRFMNLFGANQVESKADKEFHLVICPYEASEYIMETKTPNDLEPFHCDEVKLIFPTATKVISVRGRTEGIPITLSASDLSAGLQYLDNNQVEVLGWVPLHMQWHPFNFSLGDLEIISTPLKEFIEGLFSRLGLFKPNDLKSETTKMEFPMTSAATLTTKSIKMGKLEAFWNFFSIGLLICCFNWLWCLSNLCFRFTLNGWSFWGKGSQNFLNFRNIVVFQRAIDPDIFHSAPTRDSSRRQYFTMNSSEYELTTSNVFNYVTDQTRLFKLFHISGFTVCIFCIAVSIVRAQQIFWFLGQLWSPPQSMDFAHIMLIGWTLSRILVLINFLWSMQFILFTVLFNSIALWVISQYVVIHDEGNKPSKWKLLFYCIVLPFFEPFCVFYLVATQFKKLLDWLTSKNTHWRNIVKK